MLILEDLMLNSFERMGTLDMIRRTDDCNGSAITGSDLCLLCSAMILNLLMRCRTSPKGGGVHVVNIKGVIEREPYKAVNWVRQISN